MNYREGRFVEAGNRFWFPDDVTLGYIIGIKCILASDFFETNLFDQKLVIEKFREKFQNRPCLPLQQFYWSILIFIIYNTIPILSSLHRNYQ